MNVIVRPIWLWTLFDIRPYSGRSLNGNSPGSSVSVPFRSVLGEIFVFVIGATCHPMIFQLAKGFNLFSSGSQEDLIQRLFSYRFKGALFWSHLINSHF
jgi:hypothetical protein